VGPKVFQFALYTSEKCLSNAKSERLHARYTTNVGVSSD
jgi:hypothetical protein